jgi:phosphoglucomutase
MWQKMVDSLTKLKDWIGAPSTPADLRMELEDLLVRHEAGDRAATDDIEDRFYRDLEFGTAGLRGILGAGTNRMNTTTVRRATQGYAEHILANFGAKNAEGRNKERPKVAIAYDNRRNSDLFAFEAACVFIANGIETHLYSRLSSTPMLSWTVRELDCDGGVVVTASHNPKQYNGYKIYNDRGCQCLEADASGVSERISGVDLNNGIKTVADAYKGSPAKRVRAAAESEPLLFVIPNSYETKFVDIVTASATLRKGVAANLSVCFTPLNGTGNIPVRKALADIGTGRVEIVPEQQEPDPDFTTAPEPNPEKAAALEKALQLCRARMDEGMAPDIIIATDPDCDRVGCAVYDGSDYAQLTGNQVGVLMLDYIVNARAETDSMPENPLVITTIVSTPLAYAIAEAAGAELIKTLTGFKYIGDVINSLESSAARFIFGYEESCGYLAHPHVRDKDGVGTSMLLCEMAGYYKGEGRTLMDRLGEIYERFGYYIDATDELVRPGKSGMDEIKSAMDRARAAAVDVSGRESLGIVSVTDYLPGAKLPPSNVVQYDMADGGRIILRPSGTEPKLKIYYSAKGADRESAKDGLMALKSVVEKIGIGR